MNAEPFKAWHLAAMDPQHLRAGADAATLEWGEILAANGPAITYRIDSRVVFCFGIIYAGAAGAWVWSYLDGRTGRNVVRFYRAGLRLIRAHVGRLWASTEIDFPAGARCLEMMGFERRGLVSDRFPDETEAWLYAIG